MIIHKSVQGLFKRVVNIIIKYEHIGGSIKLYIFISSKQKD